MVLKFFIYQINIYYYIKIIFYKININNSIFIKINKPQIYLSILRLSILRLSLIWFIFHTVKFIFHLQSVLIIRHHFIRHELIHLGSFLPGQNIKPTVGSCIDILRPNEAPHLRVVIITFKASSGFCVVII